MLLAPGSLDLTRSDTRFFSKYAALLDILLRVGDLAIVGLTGWGIYALRFGSISVASPYRTAIVLAMLLTVLIYPTAHIYRSWRGAGLTSEILRVWAAWVGVFAALFALTWLVKESNSYSRLWTTGWFAAGAVLFALHRIASRGLLRFVRTHGMDTRKVLLVGATHAGKKIVEATRQSPWMGIQVVGYVSTPYDQADMGQLPHLATLDEYVAAPGIHASDQLWIALPMRAELDIRRVVKSTDQLPATVRLVPDLFGYELLNQHATEFAGVPVLTLRGSRITGKARIVKAVEDRVLSALILVMISPLMALLAIGVKLSSPGPVFFKQKRHGLNGKEVEVWKFRSMRLHTEDAGHVTQATRNDPRVTRFGAFMRRTSLDELPQFINVLCGSMSIVGPRPHALAHDVYYQKLVAHYVRRHQVKPGITGLAQINGLRGETETLEKMAKRIEFDVMYIRTWSLWLDLRIIFRTILTGFVGNNVY